jgi:hypothetical protein
VYPGAGLRQVFPLLSAAQSNPPGLAAGSRGSFRGSRGNDPRTRGLEILASWRDARTARWLVKAAPCPGKVENRLAAVLASLLGAGGFVRVYPVVGPLPLADHSATKPPSPSWVTLNTISMPALWHWPIPLASNRPSGQTAVSALLWMFECAKTYPARKLAARWSARNPGVLRRSGRGHFRESECRVRWLKSGSMFQP